MKTLVIPPLKVMEDGYNKLPNGFNWLAVLKDLAAGAVIDGNSFDTLVEMANMWPTCACGQLCSVLPRKEPYNEPVDRTLYSLGLDFCYAIEETRWTEAMDLFHQIEARATELIIEMDHK
jgi:hypothetical protein